MNRIVIIGNGFDLAQGLKTSYEDFLLDYFKTEIRKKIEDPDHPGDDLIFVSEQNNDIRNFEENYSNISKLSDFIQEVPIYNNSSEVYYVGVYPSIAIEDRKFKRFIEIKVISDFFYKLLQNKNWTDIEKSYFEELNSTFQNYKSDKEQLINKVVELNKNFGFLKLKLFEYLRKVENVSEKLKFEDILTNCFKSVDNKYFINFFGKSFDSKESINISNVIFLNFNYTNTLKVFFEKLDFYYKMQSIHFQIHGNIDEPNSIIFGYGDDASNSKYKELEEADMRELLENFKSIHYPKTKHYNDLMNIIEAEPFDVIVLGHSMGLSDRVLLESIFEHENCRAIRMFHRGNLRSFEDKVIAISRHFKNKQSMRRKIVEYNQLDVLGKAKAN